VESNPDSLIAVGIKPTTAHAGFRYINTGKAVSTQNKEVFTVKKFTDKPSEKQAEKYLSSGNFLWNTGYFISHADHVLNLYKKYQPKAYSLLMKIKPHIGTAKQSAMIEKYYAQMPEFDFEEILIAHPENLLALKAAFDWADIGRWSVIKDIQSGKESNLYKGLTLSHEAKGLLIYNYNPKQLVTALHVKNLVIVVTPEAVLIANKENSEELKKLIEKIKADPKLKKYL
jgi:mannose-1-phosphate guanylyltransferase